MHQVGKVGSQSVYKALQEHVTVPVFQTHAMNLTQRYFNEDNPAPPPGHAQLPPHIIRAQEFVKTFLRPAKPFAIVSMVRDPAARNASGFFQNLGRYPRLTDGGSFAPVEEFLDVFLSEWDHEEADRWFDYSFNSPLGVNVFDHEFDKERGCVEFAASDRAFLVMQAEISDENKSVIVKDFLRLPSFEIAKRINVTNQKDHAEIYREFRKRLGQRTDYLDKMYNSKIASHFYTKEQLDRFRSRWAEMAGSA